MQSKLQLGKLPSRNPNELHIDGERLFGMREVLEEWKIKDVVVVRFGQLGYEWHDRAADRPGAIYSCTKSVLSALIGIAVMQQKLDIQQPLSDFFPQLVTDSIKRRITVEHLLTMTAGFDWPEFDKPYFHMRREADWVQYILEQPALHEPGEVFAYNSGCSHLLSAIITSCTGRSALGYAEQYLFSALGITKYKWNHSSGISEGGAGLHLTSIDLAKLGVLYIQEGRWGDAQLLPADWIQLSTRMHNKGLMNFKPQIYGSYGYHWWQSSREHNTIVDCYFALGYGGQYLLVIPDLELTVVIRKTVEGKQNAIFSKRLLFEYLLPAIEPAEG